MGRIRRQKYDQMVMKEMKSQGKSFGTETNPRQQREQNSQKTSVSNPVENEKYSYPLKRNEFMLVTSPFGMRKDPLNPANTQMHKGIDIQAKHDNVLATEDKGKVTRVNNNPNTAGGLSVTVEYNRNDGSKYQCTYMHLSSIAVKAGDNVNAGQRLGVTGNTGTRTTGEHLHFGVKSISADGKARDIDPAAYLAEISQKGNIQLQTLHNGKDINAQYKISNPASQGEEEKMQTVTDSVVSKSIDLSSLLPSYKACSVNIQDGKPYLHVDTRVKIKYNAHRLMAEERRKEYNVYPKLQVYNVFNVAQTNLQEARPELYKKLEAAAGVNRPLNQGDAPDLSKINLSPTKYRGDDRLVEDEHYAVVYNPTVGGTYDVMRKVSAEEIKDNIIRYGLPEDATDDVKEVAKQMEKEEVVAQEEEQHYHRGR